MITKARFKNFKLLRDVEIELGQLNVIVGANGSGKSSVLDGLHYLLQLTTFEHRGDGQSGGRARDFFQKHRAPTELLSQPDGQVLTLAVTTSKDAAVELVGTLDETFDCHWEMTHGPARTDFGDPHQTRDFFQALGMQRLASVVKLQLDAASLSRPHYSTQARLRLEFDGAGLASVLQRIQTARDGRLELIENDLRKVLPSVRRIRTQPEEMEVREKILVDISGTRSWVDQVRTVNGARLEVEWAEVGWIPARHVSEGTLLVIGLATLLHDSPPALVLIDDLDRALHPTAQVELVALLRRFLDAHPAMQVLATTHSPYVVDAIEPEHVLVASCPDGKSTRIRKLSDNPEWVKRKEYFKPGEFWSAVGEAWVGAPPA